MEKEKIKPNLEAVLFYFSSSFLYFPVVDIDDPAR
jgi:hypothetical protein